MALGEDHRLELPGRTAVGHEGLVLRLAAGSNDSGFWFSTEAASAVPVRTADVLHQLGQPGERLGYAGAQHGDGDEPAKCDRGPGARRQIGADQQHAPLRAYPDLRGGRNSRLQSRGHTGRVNVAGSAA